MMQTLQKVLELLDEAKHGDKFMVVLAAYIGVAKVNGISMEEAMKAIAEDWNNINISLIPEGNAEVKH